MKFENLKLKDKDLANSYVFNKALPWIPESLSCEFIGIDGDRPMFKNRAADNSDLNDTLGLFIHPKYSELISKTPFQIIYKEQIDDNYKLIVEFPEFAAETDFKDYSQKYLFFLKEDDIAQITLAIEEDWYRKIEYNA